MSCKLLSLNELANGHAIYDVSHHGVKSLDESSIKNLQALKRCKTQRGSLALGIFMT